MAMNSNYRAAAIAMLLPFAGIAHAETTTTTVVVPPTEATNAKLDGVGAIIWYFRDGSKVQCGVKGDSGIAVDAKGLVRQFTYSQQYHAYLYQSGKRVGQEADVLIHGNDVVAESDKQRGKLPKEQAAPFLAAFANQQRACGELLQDIKAQLAQHPDAQMPFDKTLALGGGEAWGIEFLKLQDVVPPAPVTVPAPKAAAPAPK